MTKIMMLGTQKSKMVTRVIIGRTIKQFAVGTNSVDYKSPVDLLIVRCLLFCLIVGILSFLSGDP